MAPGDTRKKQKTAESSSRGTKWRKREQRHYKRKSRKNPHNALVSTSENVENNISYATHHGNQAPTKGKNDIKPVESNKESKQLVCGQRLTVKPFTRSKLGKGSWPEIRIPPEIERQSAKCVQKIVAAKNEICRNWDPPSSNEIISLPQNISLLKNKSMQQQQHELGDQMASDPSLRDWLQSAKRKNKPGHPRLENTKEIADDFKSEMKQKRESVTKNIRTKFEESTLKSKSIENEEQKIDNENNANEFDVMSTLGDFGASKDIIVQDMIHTTLPGVRTMDKIREELLSMMKAVRLDDDSCEGISSTSSCCSSQKFWTANDSFDNGQTDTTSEDRPAQENNPMPWKNEMFFSKTSVKDFENKVRNNMTSRRFDFERMKTKITDEQQLDERRKQHSSRGNSNGKKQRHSPPWCKDCDWFDEMLTVNDATDSENDSYKNLHLHKPSFKKLKGFSPALTLSKSCDWFDEMYKKDDVSDYNFCDIERNIPSFMRIEKPSPLGKISPLDCLYNKPFNL
ncbi:uncharacterized protein LOC120344800 isoform X2 [Styela clava]